MTKQDAMVVGVPASVLHKQAAPFIERSGTVRNTAKSKALTRAAADAADVARKGMYTDEEYNECLVHAVKGHTQRTLCAKYGLSCPTLSRGIKRGKEHLKMAHAFDDQGCMNLLDKSSDDDLLAVLVELRRSGAIRSMGGVPLPNDIEIRTLMATAGVMGAELATTNTFIDSLDSMGGKMLAAIGKASERGEEVVGEEEKRAWRYKKAKINPKTWRDWCRKYNKAGGGR